MNVCLLRSQKPEHSVLPDDDTTVAHAHVAKRSVVDQDIVLSTTVRPLSWACVLLLRALASCVLPQCIGCPPPSKWACSECTFEQPLCDECECVCAEATAAPVCACSLYCVSNTGFVDMRGMMRISSWEVAVQSDPT